MFLFFFHSSSPARSRSYRKAPEAPFPAAFDDCLEGLLAFASSAARFGVDSARVAVAGDSAGGNLALAVTAHLHSGAAGASFRAARLGLIYPAVQALDFDLPSFHENAFEPVLTRDDLFFFWHAYLTGNAAPKWAPHMAGWDGRTFCIGVGVRSHCGGPSLLGKGGGHDADVDLLAGLPFCDWNNDEWFQHIPVSP